MYDIQLFGRLEVRTRGVRLAGGDFGGVRPRHILALLALRGAMHRTELADLLCDGRPPAGPMATVEDDVTLLRHRLDPTSTVRNSVITSSNGGYELVAERVRVDVARFDELVAAAHGRTAERALRPLTAAAHLADRPLLADEEPAWATAARSRYRAKLRAALLDAAGHARVAGRPREALELAARAMEINPVAERGWLLSMTARYEPAGRVAPLPA
jgi:DNA-binding SARP family transcriptional activator